VPAKPPSSPPQITTALPVHTAVASARAVGVGPETAVLDQLSVAGTYRAPLCRRTEAAMPPQKMASVPVQATLWRKRASGAGPEVGTQESVTGL
jgi:hypothetical protein